MLHLSENFRVQKLPLFPLGDIAREVLLARNAGRDIIDLGQFSPSLPPPGAAVEKLVQSTLQPHNHRYSASQGITKLRQSIVHWYRERVDVRLDQDSQVVATMGTKEGISHLLLAVANSGDSMLLPTPCYPIHSAAISLAGANMIGVPLYLLEDKTEQAMLTGASDGFFERLSSAYDHSWPRPIMMILSFPHNPTSSVVTPEFFSRLVQFALEKKLFLVHDFAYADIGFDGYHPPSILSAPGALDCAVEFCSFSKGLNMAGWRMGFCAGNEKLVAALKKIKSYLDCGSFQPIQIGAIRALGDYESTLVETTEVYRERRDVFCAGLHNLGWKFEIPKGGVFVWCQIPEPFRRDGSLAFSRLLLDKVDISTCPGIGFGVEGDQHIRFALSESEMRLREALKRLRALQ